VENEASESRVSGTDLRNTSPTASEDGGSDPRRRARALRTEYSTPPPGESAALPTVPTSSRERCPTVRLAGDTCLSVETEEKPLEGKSANPRVRTVQRSESGWAKEIAHL